MTQNGRGMHPEDVKAAIRKSFGSLAAFAAQHGLHRSAVPKVIRDAHHSQKTEKRVAAALGKSPHVIWPERWASDGTPLPRHPSDTARASESSQKREAA